MALSEIALCTAALLKLGAAQISSFDEDSVEAEVASALYAITRDGLLSMHYWSFARGQRQLDKETAVPVADFANSYKLPNDFIRAERLGDRATARIPEAYRIMENRLHTDADPAVLTYTFRPNSPSWPPYFDTVLIAYLRAAFAMPVTENERLAIAMEQAANLALRQARLADSQQDTPEALQHFPLTDVRG